VLDLPLRIVCSRSVRLVLTLAWIAPLAVRADEPTAADLEFFETHIRPVFAEHCYECHAGEEVEGGLRLNSSAGWLSGGDTGPALVAGKPDESLLVEAIRYDSYIQMPPTGKLPADKIRLIVQWVTRGAPAPSDSNPAVKRTTIDLGAGRAFWAYQPIVNSPPPDAPDGTAGGAAMGLDRYVLARLEEAGIPPQAEADPAVLVRRLYFDLLGLPPTPDEIDCFLNDDDPDAYAALVDRLLASPQFGERWGRHWLDVVRFAQSLTLRGFILPEAWRYRDYVIESFASDRPYDEFLREQIAGDLLAADGAVDHQRKLIATTFLALGNTNLEEQDKRQLDMDVVDEQLDVIGKALLGQTIGCARCHDHKFDPIPTRDYYALAGILRNTQALEHANVSKWMEVPLPLPADEEAELSRQESAIAALEKQVVAARDELAKLTDEQTSSHTAPVVVAASELPGIVVDDRQAKKVGQWQESQYSKRYIGDGYAHDLDQDKGEKTLTFAPELPESGRYEVRLAYTPGNNRSTRVPVTVFSADGEKTFHVDMQQLPPLDGRWVSFGEFRCEAAGQNFVLVATEGTTGHVIADAVQYLPIDERLAREASAPTDGEQSPEVSAEVAARRKKLERLESELDTQRKAARKRPMVMTVVERKEISDVAIHIRGSVHTLGEVVPRGFLQVISTDPCQPLPADESGRRELAGWITDPENPLTARVMANRVWHWLFGAGLVRTVDNFGTTGEPPSHPELLDHLADRFIDGGWRVKRLVRYIVLSDTYRRSSLASDIGLRIDPENRLLWRANRKRLDAECLRDAMLAVAGRLDLTVGGPTIRSGATADFNYVDKSQRRSVYVPVLRNSIPELFEVFDFPETSMVVGRRNQSTVAPQALFMLNSPFVREQSAAAARALLAGHSSDDDRAIELAFRQTLGRPPRPVEAELAHQILAAATADAQHCAWADLYQVLFASLDFRYCD
jgi:hypothetical protein